MIPADEATLPDRGPEQKSPAEPARISAAPAAGGEPASSELSPRSHGKPPLIAIAVVIVVIVVGGVAAGVWRWISNQAEPVAAQTSGPIPTPVVPNPEPVTTGQPAATPTPIAVPAPAQKSDVQAAADNDKERRETTVTAPPAPTASASTKRSVADEASPKPTAKKPSRSVKSTADADTRARDKAVLEKTNKTLDDLLQ